MAVISLSARFCQLLAKELKGTQVIPGLGWNFHAFFTP